MFYILKFRELVQNYHTSYPQNLALSIKPLMIGWKICFWQISSLRHFMVLSVTYYFELCNAVSFFIERKQLNLIRAYIPSEEDSVV